MFPRTTYLRSAEITVRVAAPGDGIYAEIQASTTGDSFTLLGFGLAVDEEDESAPAVPGSAQGS